MKKTNEQKRHEAVYKCYLAWKDWVHPDNLELLPNYDMLDNLVKIFHTYGLKTNRMERTVEQKT